MTSQKNTQDEQESDAPTGLTCPQCDHDQIVTSIREVEYEYGTGEAAIAVQVKIPVRRCPECECQYTDWEAEEIQHNALCSHFGVLNPSEVGKVRSKYRMSRTEFSQLTGLGEDSLRRWEKGINIQNLSDDRFLRLLDDPEVLMRLRQIVCELESRRRNIVR